MKQPLVDFTPTLSEVHSKFTAWRRIKKHGSRIPEDLWTAAVLLVADNSLHKVCRTLSLSHKELKNRVQAHTTAKNDRSSSNPSPDFISIDIPHPQQHTAECIIEMAHYNGNKMRMCIKGMMELDLQSFAESFWSARQ